MKPARLMAAAVLASSLLGLACGLTYQPAPRSPKLAQPQRTKPTGEVRHDASGISFSTDIETWRFMGKTQYDEQGYDISVGFNSDRLLQPLALTFYVYPGPEMRAIGAAPDSIEAWEENQLQGLRAEWLAEMKSRHPRQRALADPPIWPLAIPMATSAAIEYPAEPSDAPTTTELHLFLVDHRWLFKVRATYPSGLSGVSREELNKTVTAVRLPE